MRVTDVTFRTFSKGSVLAYVDIEFDKAFTSKGWRLFEGRDGREYDLGLPSEPDKNGKKDEKTGQVKWWPTIWIDYRTDEGKKLMDHIKEEVFARFDSKGTKAEPKNNKNESPKKPAGGVAERRDEYNDDDIPF